ncbi:hypothetical protein BGZ58_002040, partial [Dissophora ornata]
MRLVLPCNKTALDLDAVHQAHQVKLQCQEMIGAFIERVFALEAVQASDRVFLDYLCPRVKSKALNEEDKQEATRGEDEDDDQDSLQARFLKCFMTSLYTRNLPSARGVAVGPVKYNPELGELCRNGKKVGVGEVVSMFIQRLGNIGIQTSVRIRSEINIPSALPAEVVIEKKQGRMKSSTAGPSPCIQKEKSAIENFMALNKIAGSNRRMVPISRVENGSISLSELELVRLFWRIPILKEKILGLARVHFPGCTSKEDAIYWLGDREPGYIVKRFLCDVAPDGLSVRQRGKAGYRGAVQLMSMDQIRDHLQHIREPDFEPSTYATKGYLLRGSICTDGFELQLSGFKLKELQSVRYKRLPEDKLPPRFTSTVGGTDYYLQEIRNVVKTEDDVARIWPGCRPEDIEIVCLDLGQAFTVAASAILTDSNDPNSASKGKAPVRMAVINSTTATPILSATTAASVSSTLPPQGDHIFHNLAVNQKAISQPTFKHRRWMETEKRLVPPGTTTSIEEIESGLPPLRGEGASIITYFEEVQKFEEQLESFYNGKNNRYKSHGFDQSRAREEEFKTIANSIIRELGGSIGAKRKADKMLVIGIGLGQFESMIRLSSLHGSFFAYFVNL